MDAIPWYKSPVLKGIVVAICAQIISRVKAKYHIDFDLYGLSADDMASWLMDIISGVALAYAGTSHARQVNPKPPESVPTPPQGGPKP